MSGGKYPLKLKDPGATLEYPFGLADELSPGRSIAVAVVTIADNDTLNPESPVQLSSLQTDIVGTDVVPWLTGGTPGKTYRVTCRYTDDATPTARIDERTMLIRVTNL